MFHPSPNKKKQTTEETEREKCKVLFSSKYTIRFFDDSSVLQPDLIFYDEAQHLHF